MGLTKVVNGGITLDKRCTDNNNPKVFDVSRLQCVQSAVHSQIDTIRKTAPDTICVLIAFSNDITVQG
jgi:hypothetical protein